MGSGRSVSACLSLVTWALVSQETNVFGTHGRYFSFSSTRLQKKNRNMALLSDILSLGQKKRTRKMSYECLDARKGCHATL
jgi:hypothetical protein